MTTKIEPKFPFTPADICLFNAEGWDVFEAGGSMANENGDREYQLQRIDEAAILPDDVTAWKLVWTKFQEGSAPHAKAINFLYLWSPDEFEAIMAECHKPH